MQSTMDIWVSVAYLLFLLSILWGWIACWRGELPFPQKLFWSAVILIFPMAGTLVYFLIAKDAQDLLS